MFMRNECKYYAPCGLCTYYNKPCDETTKITKPVCNNVSDETQNHNQLSENEILFLSIICNCASGNCRIYWV